MFKPIITEKDKNTLGYISKIEHDIEKEINSLRAEYIKKISELQNKKERIKSVKYTDEEFKLAEYLHKKLCTYNHTDGCGWYYDGTWSQNSRKEYLQMAKDLLELDKSEVIVRIVDCIKKRRL